MHNIYHPPHHRNYPACPYRRVLRLRHDPDSSGDHNFTLLTGNSDNTVSALITPA